MLPELGCNNQCAKKNDQVTVFSPQVEADSEDTRAALRLHSRFFCFLSEGICDISQKYSAHFTMLSSRDVLLMGCRKISLRDVEAGAGLLPCIP